MAEFCIENFALLNAGLTTSAPRSSVKNQNIAVKTTHINANTNVVTATKRWA